MIDRWTVRECRSCDLIWSWRWSSDCPRCGHPGETRFDVVRVDLEGSGSTRRGDTRTARAAATPRRGTQRWKVLEQIRACGSLGATSHELEALTGIRYASLTPRIGELKRGGFIKATGRERCGKYGVDQEVLVAIDRPQTEQSLF